MEGSVHEVSDGAISFIQNCLLSYLPKQVMITTSSLQEHTIRRGSMQYSAYFMLTVDNVHFPGMCICTC